MQNMVAVMVQGVGNMTLANALLMFAVIVMKNTLITLTKEIIILVRKTGGLITIVSFVVLI